jgi:hypothetical protein
MDILKGNPRESRTPVSPRRTKHTEVSGLALVPKDIITVQPWL